MKKNSIIILGIVIISIILYFVFSILISNESKDYNYEILSGNSYVASDNSYLVLNNNKTFYWYKDIDNRDDYYYGTYTVYRGENAIKYISSDLATFSISEESQRKMINESGIKNAIDHYFNLNLKNEKLVENGVEKLINKDTRYYGLTSFNYKELDFINMSTSQKAVFKYDK